MRLAVAWSAECSADIKRMHHETASNIGAEVRAFVRGERDVEQLEDDNGQRHLCIRAEGGVALVRVVGSTLYVERLIADKPLPPNEPLLDDPPPPDSE